MKTCILFAVIFAIFGSVPRPNTGQATSAEDIQVSILDWQELTYPPLARQARVEGIVVLQVKLDGQGKVVSAERIWGSTALAPDCLTNVKKWRFRPNPQLSLVVVYNFRIGDGVCHPGAPTSHFALWPPNFATITTCEEPVQP